jgi:predicted Zn-dependent peptidase
MGHLGVTRRDPSCCAAEVLGQILGGSMGSRLSKAIRVDKGLSYDVSGGFTSGRFLGVFELSASSGVETTAEVVEAMIREVRHLRARPPSQEEADSARSYILGSFAGAHETPQSIAWELWSLELEGLSMDFLDRHFEHVRTITPEELAESAQQLVQPEHLVIVVVGDASRLLKELRRIAPVSIVKKKQVFRE